MSRLKSLSSMRLEAGGILFGMLFLAGIGMASEIATTASGEKVILYDNYTWTYDSQTASSNARTDTGAPQTTG